MDSDLESVRNLMRGSVLEIGCGSQGRRGRFQPPIGDAERWVFVDLRHGIRPTLQADTENLPFNAAEFDRVICLEVLEYVSDPVASVIEMCRVLKSEGTLILSCRFLHRSDTTTDRWRFTEHGLRRIIDSAGMKVECIKPQGAALAVAVSILRFGVSRISSRLWRNALASAFALPFKTMLALDGTTSQNLPVLQTFSTGYLAVAVKENQTARGQAVK